MNMQTQRDISRKLKMFVHAAGSGSVAFTLQTFWNFKRNLLPVEAGLCRARRERAYQ
jgi:hypothetical protein